MTRLCECGRRFVPTTESQTKCIQCLYKKKELKTMPKFKNKICQWEGCAKIFTPASPRQIYCDEHSELRKRNHKKQKKTKPQQPKHTLSTPQHDIRKAVRTIMRFAGTEEFVIDDKDSNITIIFRLRKESA
jgi:hypothetical protein